MLFLLSINDIKAVDIGNNRRGQNYELPFSISYILGSEYM